MTSNEMMVHDLHVNTHLQRNMKPFTLDDDDCLIIFDVHGLIVQAGIFDKFEAAPVANQQLTEVSATKVTILFNGGRVTFDFHTFPKFFEFWQQNWR